MIEDRAREDIALIRHAIEDGAAYATAGSPDMLVWGIAVAIGYLGTYACIRGWLPVTPGLLWAACLGLPWLFRCAEWQEDSPDAKCGLVARWRRRWRCCGSAAASF